MHSRDRKRLLGGRIRQIVPYQLGRTKPFPVIIDVREEEQFVLGHINGAKRISPDSLEESIRDVVPHLATPIVVYCAAGDRCASVADRLQRMGYRDISTLKGGLRGLVGSRRTSRVPDKIAVA